MISNQVQGFVGLDPDLHVNSVNSANMLVLNTTIVHS